MALTIEKSQTSAPRHTKYIKGTTPETKNKIDIPTTCTTGEGEGVNDIANNGIHTLYLNTVQNICFKMEIKRKEKKNVYMFAVGVRGGH